MIPNRVTVIMTTTTPIIIIMNTTPGPMAPAYIPDIITDTRVMVIMAARHYTLDLAGAALA